MSELSAVTVQVLVLVEQLKRSVMPAVLERTLAELASRPGPIDVPPAAELIRLIDSMSDDQDLRFYLHERASVRAAMRLRDAFHVYAAAIVSRPPDSDVFRAASAALIESPSACHIARTGLALLERQDREERPE